MTPGGPAPRRSVGPIAILEELHHLEAGEVRAKLDSLMSITL
jgi:hypothetical protein